MNPNSKLMKPTPKLSKLLHKASTQINFDDTKLLRLSPAFSDLFYVFYFPFILNFSFLYNYLLGTDEKSQYRASKSPINKNKDGTKVKTHRANASLG